MAAEPSANETMPPHHGAAAMRSGSGVRRVLSSSAVLVPVRLFALALSFGIGLLTARSLGAAEFGRFESWLACAGIVGIALGLGTDRMVLRFTASYRDQRDWAALRGLLDRLGGVLLLGCGTLAALGLGALACGLGDRVPGGPPMLLGLVLVASTVTLRFLQAAVQGLDRVLSSQLADLLVTPVTFAIVLLVLRARRGTLHGVDALAGQGVAVAVAAAWLAAVYVRSRPRELRGVAPVVHVRAWWRDSWLLLVLAFCQIGVAKLDLVVFGQVGDPHDLGHYAAARRIAGPIVAVTLAVNAAAAPMIARLHARGARGELQALATRMARWTTLAAAAIGLGSVVAAPTLLPWFGPDFTDAEGALRILVVAQILNTACGSVILLLIMTGRTRHALPGLALGAVTQVALGAALIPRYGLVGAAVASSAATVVWNVLCAVAVCVHLGIDPSVLGRAPRPDPSALGDLVR